MRAVGDEVKAQPLQDLWLQIQQRLLLLLQALAHFLCTYIGLLHLFKSVSKLGLCLPSDITGIRCHLSRIQSKGPLRYGWCTDLCLLRLIRYPSLPPQLPHCARQCYRIGWGITFPAR